MNKIKVSTGIYWIEFPEAGMYILCGSPADSVKHLMKKGLIVTREKDGISYETGPNAILLSDLPVQNERFANLAEFPVLQMLYRQGMILPNHPNNTGQKPMLIGIEDQVKAQAEYIFRGNYGLVSKEEIIKGGITGKAAENILRMKRSFSFGKFRNTEELLDLKIIGDDPVGLRNGVFIKRNGTNLYEFIYKGKSISVDLNLKRKEEYSAPYVLGDYSLAREYFSVVHIGEGDGWDPDRPCMSSILTFQGKIYLIDAGPNIVHSLTALGVSANDIEGIFHTHAHDDHFNGLTVLLRADHKIKHYTTPLVRESIVKKLCALMSIDEESFGTYFEVHDLHFNKWNNIGGLEVKPVLSPHPLETNVLYFRALWEKGYKTYTHLADICALDVMEKMITDDETRNGISRKFFNETKSNYFLPADLKKIDIGGGMIHGNAEDFAGDVSGRLIFSHSAVPLSDRQKELGASASFGMADVLIPARQDYTKPIAYKHFEDFFPGIPGCELRIFLNCPTSTFNPGTIIIKNGQMNENLFFILSGVIEFIYTEGGVHNSLSSGSILGEISGLLDTPARGTYRALSHVSALKISAHLYSEFAKRNNIYGRVKEDIHRRNFLQSTWLFGEMVSCPVKNKIARVMKPVEYLKGEALRTGSPSRLFLIESGKVDVLNSRRILTHLSAGDFFGSEMILFGKQKLLSARASADTKIFEIGEEHIRDIPVIQWKLVETYERRIKL